MSHFNLFGCIFPAVLLFCAAFSLAACSGESDDDDSFADDDSTDDDTASDPRAEEVRAALDMAVENLLAQQAPQGYWEGKFITDTSITAYYILLMHYIENVDEAREAKAVRYILNGQNEDGSWSAWPDGPGVLDITVLDYLGLKLAGVAADDAAMAKARDWIRTQGGAESAGVMPLFMLALFGQAPWKHVPPVPTAIMLAESLLYRIGYAHAMIVPFSVIWENYRKAIPPAGRDVGEIFLEDPWAGVNERAPRLDCCQDRAIAWMLERQEDDGNWSGVFMNTMYSLMALKSTGDPAYADAIRLGMEGVVAFQNEDETTINQQFSISPVQDTGYVLDVLRSAGMDSSDERIARAVNWLKAKAVRIYGDWHHNNPDGEPGGWGFEHYNQWYPDVDCTAIVLRGLSTLDDGRRDAIWTFIQRGLDWVVTMQNDDGGWAAWDKNALNLEALIPFIDSPWLASDLSDADLTGRTLLALSSLGYPGLYGDPWAIQRAIEYEKGMQEENGAWWGRWGVNYVYGTGEALKGLAAAGEDPNQAYIRRAVDWLLGVQNEDGGWGETPASYDDPELAGIGESTAALTAYATTALIFTDGLTDEVERGIDFLLDRQLADGGWFDGVFLGTNIAGAWYARYDMASIYKPALTLAQYLAARRGDSLLR